LGDEIRLRHILDAIEEIEVYLSKVDFQSFLQDSMMRFACIKQMEIIGEASNHISEKLKSEFLFQSCRIPVTVTVSESS